MKNSFLGLFTLIFLITCKSDELQKDNSEIFTKELIELKEFFSIPGLSAVIAKGDEIVYENYFGFADIANEVKVDSSIAFPIASITKLFSATLVMKLVEKGEISLDDPVSNFISSSQLKDSIKVKHLLSHTSQGDIGEQFYYSSRFGLLTEIIEKSSLKSFKDLMEDEIFEPIDLQHTFLIEDSIQLADMDVIVASPYVLDGEIQKGFIDYGHSASAGIVSTPKDLIQFCAELDLNTLISKDSKQSMFQGLPNELPYSYGVFKQNIKGLDVLWTYGQYDCYSSLLLKIPSKDLTLVLLANNNLMSDPARLIMGDVLSSLFAISFLKNYVFDLPKMQIIEKPDSVYVSGFSSPFYMKKVLAQALSESFMARFEPQKMKVSASLIEQTIKKYPDYLSYGNINLLHTLSFLKDVAFYMDLGAFNQYDMQIEEQGQKLLDIEPNNPYVHSYLGTYYDRLGNKEKATFHFKAIVNLENFSPNWYTKEAKVWLEGNQ